ncbi:hypothetical protein LC55x_2086 [Lysobacter capsici]|nr:hypothetical protein LC55x_2086 [Lysobacter capsici]
MPARAAGSGGFELIRADLSRLGSIAEGPFTPAARPALRFASAIDGDRPASKPFLPP